MTRPSEYHILRATILENDYYLWVESDGKEVCISFNAQALLDRRLFYEFSHLAPIDDGTGETRFMLVEDVPVTDDDIIEMLITEHFDGWEVAEFPWKTQAYLPQPRDSQQDFRRQPNRERSNVELGRSVADRKDHIHDRRRRR